MDLPTDEYTAAKQPHRGRYLWNASKVVSLAGQPRFHSLCKLIMGLLTIPVSNADSECLFKGVGSHNFGDFENILLNF